MRIEDKPRTPGELIIVSARYWDEIDRRIASIREKDEPKRLEYDCEKLKDVLIGDFGVLSSRDTLVCGRRYAVLTYSPMATAIRRGKAIPYHGEIYLCAWTYYEDDMFRTESAWGNIAEHTLPGCPMIECY